MPASGSFRPVLFSLLLAAACSSAAGSVENASTGKPGAPAPEDENEQNGDETTDAGTADARARDARAADAHSDAKSDAHGDEVPSAAAATIAQFDVGANHACAVLGDGRLKCWGDNGYGQLGLGDSANRGDDPGEMGSALPAVDLGTGRKATQVSAGDQRTCAVLDDGTVKCWGDLGSAGIVGKGPAQMGDALAPVPLPGQARRVIAGMTHTCALLVDNTLRCWGSASWGQLGSGATTRIPANASLAAIDLGPGRTVASHAQGTAHTCAVLDNHTLKCWGYNADGELGLGDIQFRGSAPNEMGAALPIVNLGSGRTALAVTATRAPIIASAPADHTCALLDDHSVKCWGYNAGNYTLGIGAAGDRGNSPGSMGNTLPVVNLGSGRTAKAISAGGSFMGASVTCAILDTDQIKCWGTNSQGELGLGDLTPRGDSLASLGDNLPVVQLGSGRTVKDVVVGSGYGQGLTSCARLDDGALKCWGKNDSGQLGVGDVADRGGNATDMNDNLPAVDLGP